MKAAIDYDALVLAFCCKWSGHEQVIAGEVLDWLMSLPRIAAAPTAADALAPAGQAVVIRALTMARHALVNLRINKSAESLALANALDEALAASQAERPAVKED